MKNKPVNSGITN